MSLYGLVKSLTFNTRLHHLFIPSYEYMFSPRQLCSLVGIVTEVASSAQGSFVEVGCAYGYTTLFLNRHLRDLGREFPYHCIDTFEGFTERDVSFEVTSRDKGTHRQVFQNAFKDNDPKYLRRAVRNDGFDNVTVHRADASEFEYSSLSPIAFCLIDVDLYLPVKATLERVEPHLAHGAVIVVDDCSPGGPWDGAYEAYRDFVNDRSIEKRIVAEKLGVIEGVDLGRDEAEE